MSTLDTPEPAVYESPSTVPSQTDLSFTANVMRHEYRVLSEEDRLAINEMRDKGRDLYEFVASLGVSRELSVAKTKVEEAVMWAVKHLTR